MTEPRGSEGAPAGDGSSSALREDSSEPAATTGTGTGTSSGTGTGTETGTGPGLKSQVDLSSACRILVYPVSSGKLFPPGSDGKTTIQIATGPVESMAAALQGGTGEGGTPKLMMLPQPAQDTGPGQEFSPQAIVQLIQAVGRRWEQYSTRERGRLFQGVQQELAQNGLAFPLDRIRRKWNNLLVTYKRVRERGRYTGQPKTTWEYYEMMDALLSGSSKVQVAEGTTAITTSSIASTSTMVPPSATANAALSLAASLLSLPSLLPSLPSSPLSPPPPSTSCSTNPDPPNPAPQPPASASPAPQDGPSSLAQPRRLAARHRKLKRPAVDTAAAFLAQQHSQAERRTGLLQSFLAAQEERGRAEEEWRRREEERERRRERRERRALGTLGRLVNTLELLSSKQDTVIALLQRLADRH
ncbi:uncharacterized protein LOC136751523 [Amia ocellicauda]|uniref:uncharacterized protein LOC136751523 n=1 Tax=Amia ocellicauda TaxID=2972642 RepID=UPI0034645A60